jgi:hypothetical protein
MVFQLPENEPNKWIKIGRRESKQNRLKSGCFAKSYETFTLNV